VKILIKRSSLSIQIDDKIRIRFFSVSFLFWKMKTIGSAEEEKGRIQKEAGMSAPICEKNNEQKQLIIIKARFTLLN